MADVFIKINGAAMPCPSSFTWGLQDISASESGRTDDTIMHKNRVGQKRKLEIGSTRSTFLLNIPISCLETNMKSEPFMLATDPLLLSAGGSGINGWKDCNLT